MRAVVQKVSRAAVRVDGKTVGEIGHGLMVLAFVLGIVATLLRSDLRIPEQLYAALSIYLLFAIVVNAITGGNFAYVSHPPENPSLLDHLGPWPCLVWLRLPANRLHRNIHVGRAPD